MIFNDLSKPRFDLTTNLPSRKMLNYTSLRINITAYWLRRHTKRRSSLLHVKQEITSQMFGKYEGKFNFIYGQKLFSLSP